MAFQDDFQECSSDFDDEFGERWRIIPQIEGDQAEYFARGEDASVPERVVVGIYSEDPVISTVLGSGANTHDNADVATSRITVNFALGLFSGPSAMPVPAEGWILQREDALGRPRYEVVVAQSDGVARLVCKVVYRGPAP